MTIFKTSLPDEFDVTVQQETMSRCTLYIGIESNDLNIMLYATENQIEKLIDNMEGELEKYRSYRYGAVRNED